MSINKKPLTVVLGTAMALTGAAAHAGSLFQVSDLGAGYMVAAAGDDKKAEHKCGEGKCGGEKKTDDKKTEHKCGEGKCGGAPKPN